MTKTALLIVAVVAFGLAASRAAADESLSNETVARLAASAHVHEWNFASNNSNASEIYKELVAAGGQPACHEKRLLVNSEYVTKTDCSVTARVPRLTVKINDIVYRSTTDVDVQGETTCRAEWLAIATGRRQTAELWHFCRVTGVARPK